MLSEDFPAEAQKVAKVSSDASFLGLKMFNCHLQALAPLVQLLNDVSWRSSDLFDVERADVSMSQMILPQSDSEGDEDEEDSAQGAAEEEGSEEEEEDEE